MLKVTARAKINWSLDILGTYPNGYHEMDMLMSTVSLADTLHFSNSKTLSLQTLGNPALDTEDNIVRKAAKALQAYTSSQQGADIKLHKFIPHGAGMGGGSADAAAALLALNTLWNLHLTTQELHTIAQSLGADVPFFLYGGFARITGFGEIIAPLAPLPEIPLVILQPCKPQPTKDVFSMYDKQPHIVHPKTDTALHALLDNNWQLFGSTAGNVLQQALVPNNPPILEAISALDACDALFATMTGSGSAVFGTFASTADATAAYKVLRKRWKRCWLSHVSTQAITMEEVNTL